MLNSFSPLNKSTKSSKWCVFYKDGVWISLRFEVGTLQARNQEHLAPLKL